VRPPSTPWTSKGIFLRVGTCFVRGRNREPFGNPDGLLTRVGGHRNATPTRAAIGTALVISLSFDSREAHPHAATEMAPEGTFGMRVRRRSYRARDVLRRRLIPGVKIQKCPRGRCRTARGAILPQPVLDEAELLVLSSPDVLAGAAGDHLVHDLRDSTGVEPAGAGSGQAQRAG
jgi:hypothetical protein